VVVGDVPDGVHERTTVFPPGFATTSKAFGPIGVHDRKQTGIRIPLDVTDDCSLMKDGHGNTVLAAPSDLGLNHAVAACRASSNSSAKAESSAIQR
jgi:hypothetical protein